MMLQQQGGVADAVAQLGKESTRAIENLVGLKFPWVALGVGKNSMKFYPGAMSEGLSAVHADWRNNWCLTTFRLLSGPISPINHFAN